MASIVLNLFSSTARLTSKLVTKLPILGGYVLVGSCEVLATSLSLLSPSFPLEMADVISLVVANGISGIYYLHSVRQPRQKLLLACTTAWATRLASFLANRTMRGFRDDRLNTMRSSPSRLVTWGVAQTVWISTTLLPVWVGMCQPKNATTPPELSVVDYLATAGFGAAWLCEAIADVHRANFVKKSKQASASQPPFLQTGLFKYCRYPNYFGEWFMWSSLSVLAFRSSNSWNRVVLPVCPLFLHVIFHSLSIPIAVDKMKARLSDDDFAKWSKIPLFYPWSLRRK